MSDAEAPFLPKSQGKPHGGTPLFPEKPDALRPRYPATRRRTFSETPSQHRCAFPRTPVALLPGSLRDPFRMPGATLPGKLRHTPGCLSIASPQPDARRTQRRGLRHPALRIGIKDGCRVDAVVPEGYGSQTRKTGTETQRTETETRWSERGENTMDGNGNPVNEGESRRARARTHWPRAGA